jgi:predicted DNA-binding ribbon-helix-helix protein
MTAKHRVTVNLEDHEYEALNTIAREKRVSLAWLGRQAINELLVRYAKDERQPFLDLEPAGNKVDK